MKLSSRFSCKSYSALTLSKSTAANSPSVCVTFHRKDLWWADGISEGLRLVKNITSLVDQQTQGYISNLQNLRRSLLGQASTSAAVMVYRVFDKLGDVGKTRGPALVFPFQ